MTEPCTQETNIALIQQGIQSIQKDVTKTLIILEGNGGEGLTTKVALNRQSIKRVWWWVGAVSLTLLGITAYVLKAMMA